MPEGGEAVGVDISEAMIAEARRRHGSPHADAGASVAFRLGDALNLPYPDVTFDVCRAGTVLQHLACGWMGRQLPRLFREAGLAEVSVDPFVILGTLQAFRGLLAPAIARLRDEQVLTGERMNEWWAALSRWEAEGSFLGGSTAFVVTGTRPR
jgi:SAM-dependent methyltransferase